MTGFITRTHEEVRLLINYQVPNDAPCVENIEIEGVYVEEGDTDILDLLDARIVENIIGQCVADYVENHNKGEYDG